MWTQEEGKKLIFLSHSPFWSTPLSASPEHQCSYTGIGHTGQSTPHDHCSPELALYSGQVWNLFASVDCTAGSLQNRAMKKVIKMFCSPFWSSCLPPPFYCIKCQRTLCCGRCTLHTPKYWDALSCFCELDTPISCPWVSWRREAGRKSDEDRIFD